VIIATLILSAFAVFVATAALVIQHLQLRRTPEMPIPDISSGCTTILGVDVYRDVPNLLGHSSCDRIGSSRRPRDG
jgi:hypothetical protein